jgi:D-alanyl-D-alanine carboxypeptidase
MKGWAAAVALLAVVLASATGLWVTWDSTQTSATDPLAEAPVTLPSTTTTANRPGQRRTIVTEPGPPCTTGPGEVTGDPAADWAILVIDTGHSVPSGYAPTDLVSVSEAGFPAQDQVRAVVIDDLRRLRIAAERAGAPLSIVSAYRSYSYQQQLFQRRSDEVGEAEASLRTARPGHSEHQLGTAIDVLDPASGDLTTAFASTPQGRWVAAHSWEYGFVLSYPDGERNNTCYDYEPWHLRYVGPAIAKAIHDSHLTPRQWLLTARAGNAN